MKKSESKSLNDYLTGNNVTPFHADKPCIEKRAALVAIFVYAICFLLTASTPFEWKSIASEAVSDDERGNETNGTIKMTFGLENTELGKNVWYRLVYHWFSTIFFVLVPLVILAIGNIFLINAVRASRKVREKLTNCQFHQRQFQMMHQEDRITVTLIVVIIVFLICQLPTAAVLIYTSMYTPEPGSTAENVLLGLGNIFNLLVAINASRNFILYTALSDKYRRVFLNVFCFNSICHRWYKRKYTRTVYILPKIYPRNPSVNVRMVSCQDTFGLQTKSEIGEKSLEKAENIIYSSSGTYNLEGVQKHKRRDLFKKCVTFAEEERHPCRCKELIGFVSQAKASFSI